MMIFRKAFLIFGMIVALPISAAPACLISGSRTTIFATRPPRDIPPGAVLIKVAVKKFHPKTKTGWETAADVRVIKVLAGKVKVRRLTIAPTIWSSCTSWGAMAGDLYVRGFVKRDAAGRYILDPLENSTLGQ